MKDLVSPRPLEASVGQAQPRSLGHLAECLERAGPCCCLSLKSEEASLSRRGPLVSGPLPSEYSALSVLVARATHLCGVWLVTSVLSFPVLQPTSRASPLHGQSR